MGDMETLFIIGENFSKEGETYSGDDWIASPFNDARVCGVFDGARSPHADLKTVAGFPSDKFVSNWLKQELLQQLLDNPMAPLGTLLQRTNYAYGDMWPQLLSNEGINTLLNRKVNAPASAFAVAMVRDGLLTWVQGADCVLFLILADGKVIPLAGDQFSDIDPAKKKQQTWVSATKLLEEGHSVQEVLRRENEMIAHNRALLYNQHGGIAVLNGEPTMEEVLVVDTMDVSYHLDTGAKILAMTDGCFQKLDDRSEFAAMTAAQLVVQKGLDGLKEALLLKSNPFPTDATAVLMDL